MTQIMATNIMIKEVMGMISKNEGDDGMRVVKRPPPQCQRRKEDPPKMLKEEEW
jgi:hypothetical protein